MLMLVVSPSLLQETSRLPCPLLRTLDVRIVSRSLILAPGGRLAYFGAQMLT